MTTSDRDGQRAGAAEQAVTLWRYGLSVDVIMMEGRPFGDPMWVEHRALPAATFDALVQERDRLAARLAAAEAVVEEARRYIRRHENWPSLKDALNAYDALPTATHGAAGGEAGK